MTAVPVIFDVNVLVMAVVIGNSPFGSWPSPPPTSGNPAADSLGVINDAEEFALWLSPHILDNTGRVLAKNYGWPDTDVDRYLNLLMRLAEHSGGATVDPPATVKDCHDWEDNRILDLVVEVGAYMLVSEDTDLTAMSPWRGVPILRPRQFADRIDAMRRHHRRQR